FAAISGKQLQSSIARYWRRIAVLKDNFIMPGLHCGQLRVLWEVYANRRRQFHPVDGRRGRRMAIAPTPGRDRACAESIPIAAAPAHHVYDYTQGGMRELMGRRRMWMPEANASIRQFRRHIEDQFGNGVCR